MSTNLKLIVFPAFVLLIIISYNWIFIGSDIWGPHYKFPPLNKQIHAKGSFLVSKLDYRGNLEFYRFKLSDGRIIYLTCEPYPALNKCLSLDDGNLMTSESDIYCQLINVNQSLDPNSPEYCVISQMENSGNYLFNISNSEERIDKTQVIPLREGQTRVHRSISTDIIFLIFSIVGAAILIIHTFKVLGAAPSRKNK